MKSYEKLQDTLTLSLLCFFIIRGPNRHLKPLVNHHLLVRNIYFAFKSQRAIGASITPASISRLR